MTSWLFEFDLVPASWLRAQDVALLFRDDGSYDAAAAWSEFSGDVAQLEMELDSAMKRIESWHPDLVAWSLEPTSDIQLWRREGRICCLCACIDLREPISNLFRFVAKVVKVAGTFQLSILIAECHQIVLEPNASQLVAAAVRSAPTAPAE